MTVADSGVGLPPEFDLDSASGLGLQIVRTLVEGDLGGRLRITPGSGAGTEAVVDFPIGSDVSESLPNSAEPPSADDPSART